LDSCWAVYDDSDAKCFEYKKKIEDLVSKLTNQYKKSLLICEELSVLVELKKFAMEENAKEELMFKELEAIHQAKLEKDETYKAKWEQYLKDKEEINELKN
jgi:hypothetical protein